MGEIGAEQKWAITVIIIAALAIVSYLFNRHIDNSPSIEELPDGQTAWWVVLGTIYTLAGALGILEAWFGWGMALRAVGTVFACFIASGIPMVLGDTYRTSRRRRKPANDLEQAQKIIHSLKNDDA